MSKHQDEQENVQSIEKAKLEAINDINKRLDEKLQSNLRIFRFAVWSVSFSAVVLIGTLGILGYKGYRDIQKTVHEITKENANQIIHSSEFTKKIDDSLSSAVDQKITEMESLSKRVSSLKAKIASNDVKEVVHNLFSTIEPRLTELEKLEKGTHVQVTDSGVDFFKGNERVMTILLGYQDLTKKEIQIDSTRYPIGFTKKLNFVHAFLEPPKVFVQIDQDTKSSLFRVAATITSVKTEKDGFFITFSPLSSARMTDFDMDKVRLSWIAIGR